MLDDGLDTICMTLKAELVVSHNELPSSESSLTEKLS